MRPELENIARIDAYLKGELGSAEALAFEQEMSRLPELRQQVELQTGLNAGLEAHRLRGVANSLAAVHGSAIGGGSGAKLGAAGKGALALAAALVIGTASYLLWPQSEETAEPQSEQAIVEQEAVKAPSRQEESELMLADSMGSSERQEDLPEQGSPTTATEASVSEPRVRALEPVEPIVAEELPSENPSTDGLSGVEDVSIHKLCDTVYFAARVLASPACKDDPNGSIIVDPETIEGGTAPYSFSIDSGANFMNTPMFDHLESGVYTVIIKDANGCQATLDEYLLLRKRKRCP